MLVLVTHHLETSSNITSLCLLARTATHQGCASCGPEKQHSFDGVRCGEEGEETRVSVGEEQFLDMRLSDSLHQTFVFGSSCVHTRAQVVWDRGISSERKRFDVIAPSSSRGCKKVHSLFSSRRQSR